MKHEIPDLRTDCEEKTVVTNGMLYRKGMVVQVWWEYDNAGRPFNNGPEAAKSLFGNGRGTWTYNDVDSAKRAFLQFTAKYPPTMNEKPFQHSGPNETNAIASRCDFREGVVIIRPEGITDAEFAKDMAVIFGYHAASILPNLTSFNGYDAFSISLRLGRKD